MTISAAHPTTHPHPHPRSVPTMDKILSTHYATLDTTLTTLLTSISAYAPSVPAASALLAADDALSRALSLLATHQANHQRLISLHTTATARQAELRSTLALLASTRQNLLASTSEDSATVTTGEAQPTRRVNARELLDYAKRISKFSRDPTLRPIVVPVPSTAAAADAVAGARPGMLTPEVVVDRVGSAGTSPAGETAGEDDGAGVMELVGVEAGGALENGTLGNESRSEEVVQMMVQTDSRWVPWPTEELIRRGGLAILQRGETFVPDRETMVSERGAEDMEMNVAGEEATHDEGRRPGAGMAAEKREEKRPAVFSGLDLYDPDED